MLLTLDLGNTKIKASVFEQVKFLKSYSFTKNDWKNNLLEIIKSYPLITDIIVSSVLNFDFDLLQSNFPSLSVHLIHQESQFPFINKYQTPKTIGIDRLVLAAGATYLHQNANRLVIDAGTCITYDFINSQNEYLGGAISPGLGLKYKSVHEYTEKLPLLHTHYPNHFIGNSTEDCLHAGISLGSILEIDGFINLYKENYSDLTIILTGGDAVFLAKQLKNIIFANPNFLAESLCAIFYNSISHDKKDII